MCARLYELTREDFVSDCYKTQLADLMQESEMSNYPDMIIEPSFGAEEYEKLKQYMLSDKARVAVIIDAQTICSYVWYFILGNRVHINEIATFKRYQNRGFGKKLIEYVTAVSKNNCFSAVQLHVLESNKAALNLYSKLGFVTEKRLMRKDV